jgi:hypothetical protein
MFYCTVEVVLCRFQFSLSSSQLYFTLTYCIVEPRHQAFQAWFGIDKNSTKLNGLQVTTAQYVLFEVWTPKNIKRLLKKGKMASSQNDKKLLVPG